MKKFLELCAKLNLYVGWQAEEGNFNIKLNSPEPIDVASVLPQLTTEASRLSLRVNYSPPKRNTDDSIKFDEAIWVKQGGDVTDQAVIARFEQS